MVFFLFYVFFLLSFSVLFAAPVRSLEGLIYNVSI
jgi:hypothetical protein